MSDNILRRIDENRRALNGFGDTVRRKILHRSCIDRETPAHRAWIADLSGEGDYVFRTEPPDAREADEKGIVWTEYHAANTCGRTTEKACNRPQCEDGLLHYRDTSGKLLRVRFCPDCMRLAADIMDAPVEET